MGTFATLEDELNDLDTFVVESSTEESAVEIKPNVEPEAKPENVVSVEATPVTEEVKKEEGEVVQATPMVAEPVATPVVQPAEDTRINALMAQIENLSQQLIAVKNAQTTAAPTVTPSVTASTDEFDYLAGTDIDDVTSDPKVFNSILNKLESRLRGILTDETSKQTLLAIPDAVQYQLKQQMALNELVKEFYDSNKDLVGVKHTVAMVAQNVSSEHPDWTIREVFEDAAKKTREILKLNLPSSATTVTKELKPAFAGKTVGHEKSTVMLDELQKQLDEL